MSPGVASVEGATGTVTHQADASLARVLPLHRCRKPAGCDLHPYWEQDSQRSGDSAGHVASRSKGDIWVPGLPSTQPQALVRLPREGFTYTPKTTGNS